MEKLPVYIIYVNYNNWQDLKESLQSLFKNKNIPFSICIADNNSSDGSVNHLELLLKQQQMNVKCWDEKSFKSADATDLDRINIISFNKNYGFGKANNFILEKIIDTNAFVWLLNPDIMVMDNSLENLHNVASFDPEAVYGASIYNYHRQDQLLYNGGFDINKLTGTISFNKSNKPPEIISGGCLFTHTTILKKVGLFPEDYFLYWEDAVLCKNISAAGFKLKYIPTTIAFDKGSTTIGKGYLAEYYYSRNALKYIKNYHPFYLPFVLFFNIFRSIKRIMFLKFDKLKAIFKATTDFLKGKEYDTSEYHNH